MSDLLTISYRSVTRSIEPIRDIAAIMSESLARNAEEDISGLLLFDGNYFLQTIEGPAEAVSDLFLKIAEDPRHRDVVPCGIGMISERTFPNWGMKLMGPNATARIAPDLAHFDFSDRRLQAVHILALEIGRRAWARVAAVPSDRANFR